MKILKTLLPYIIIVSLFVYFFFNKSTNTITKYIPGDTVFTSVTIDSMIPYDTIIYDVDTLWLHDTVNTHSTDTVYVYNDFFKMYNYEIDTNISEVDINTKISITQNRLYNYEINTQNNRKTSVIMTKDNNFGIGIIAGRDLFSPVISYEFSNHNIGLGYNFVNPGMTIMYQYKFDINNIFKKE